MEDLTPHEIEHLSTLSRIYLSQDEQKDFAQQLPDIVVFIEALRQIKTKISDKVETCSVLSLRSDTPVDRGLTIKQLKRLSPRFSGRLVEVPMVFGEERE